MGARNGLLAVATVLLAMEATAAAVFNAATTTLLPQGLSPSPQVFVFDRLGGDRLVGQVTCRPYRRGQDAAVAIAELGRIAAGVVGTDLLVFWEEFDLRTSLYGSSEQHPKALVILQATLQSHFLTWFPFESDVLSWRANGLPDDVRIRRGAPTDTVEGAQLSEPIYRLLALWRAGIVAYDFDECRRIVTSAVKDGYDVSFVTQSHD